MFFRIARGKTDRFSYHHALGDTLVLGVDSGWHCLDVPAGSLFYKGYSSDHIPLDVIARRLYDQPTLQFQGNFCVIIHKNDQVTITHDSCRSFPLWHDGDSVTNLEPLAHSVWADAHIIMDRSGTFHVDPLPKHTPGVSTSYNDTLHKVHDIICNTFENFLTHNKLPLKIFVSGGVDTVMCYSYLKKFTNRFELIDYEYKKFTYFYKKNWHDRLQRFWAYRQIHTWGEEPVALVSGGCGDEYFMRGPITANLFLIGIHGTNINRLLPAHENDYMYDYLTRESTQKKLLEHETSDRYRSITSTKKNTIKYIESNLVNDHQHWHIDDTITFTPFKNIAIPFLIMNLSLEDYEKQIMNAQLNKDLISLNDSDDLKLISKFKNRNSFENLV